MPATDNVNIALDGIIRGDRGRLLALLASRIGDFSLAEDCMQEAIVQALNHWPKKGLPDNPHAWLFKVAKNKALDSFRRQQNWHSKAQQINTIDSYMDDHLNHQTIPDQRLQLLFICCHPALDKKSRVALTLRIVGGLSTAEIARALLDKPATIGQRISRAKAKINLAGITYAMPEGKSVNDRIDSVLQVIYLIYNEGYWATSGATSQRLDLAQEALFLAQLMQQLAPEVAEVQGLYALLLLSHARRAARTGSDGSSYIPLERQQRHQWQSEEIRQGSKLIQQALRLKQLGPYQLQAAIQAVHCEAISYADTDWAQIKTLYDLLLGMQNSPVTAAHRAVAVMQMDGPTAALVELDQLAHKLPTYQPYYAVRAEVLFRLQRFDDAASCWHKALALCPTPNEQAYLRHKLEKCLQLGQPS